MYICILSKRKKKGCIFACMRKTNKPHVCVYVKRQTKQIKRTRNLSHPHYIYTYCIYNRPKKVYMHVFINVVSITYVWIKKI